MKIKGNLTELTESMSNNDIAVSERGNSFQKRDGQFYYPNTEIRFKFKGDDLMIQWKLLTEAVITSKEWKNNEYHNYVYRTDQLPNIIENFPKIIENAAERSFNSGFKNGEYNIIYRVIPKLWSMIEKSKETNDGISTNCIENIIGEIEKWI